MSGLAYDSSTSSSQEIPAISGELALLLILNTNILHSDEDPWWGGLCSRLDSSFLNRKYDSKGFFVVRGGGILHNQISVKMHEMSPNLEKTPLFSVHCFSYWGMMWRGSSASCKLPSVLFHEKVLSAWKFNRLSSLPCSIKNPLKCEFLKFEFQTYCAKPIDGL